jgi:WD40 repeat protein
MTATRTRDAALTVIGLAAVLLYILACASFSPDDSKVLFPSNDPKTGGTVLAVYDRGAHTTRALLAFPPATGDNNDGYMIRPAWTPDGSHVVALWGDTDKELRITVLPISGKGPTRMLVVKNVKGDASSAMLVPPTIVGSQLFMGEDGQIRRVDLESGVELVKTIEGELLLAGQSGRIYYGRELSEEGKETRTEVGLVDANTLALTPLFETIETAGNTPFFAVSRDGARVAIAGGKDDEQQILVFEGNQLRNTIPIGGKPDEMRLGFFQWSHDGATLYGVFRTKVADSEYQLGVLEIPASGGTARRIPLFRVTGKEDSDMSTLQVDVSHDGKTIAAASTYLQTSSGAKAQRRLKPEDLALYFIDLSRPDRKITKVPIPPLPAPVVAEAK